MQIEQRCLKSRHARLLKPTSVAGTLAVVDLWWLAVGTTVGALTQTTGMAWTHGPQSDTRPLEPKPDG